MTNGYWNLFTSFAPAKRTKHVSWTRPDGQIMLMGGVFDNKDTYDLVDVGREGAIVNAEVPLIR